MDSKILTKCRLKNVMHNEISIYSIIEDFYNLHISRFQKIYKTLDFKTILVMQISKSYSDEDSKIF